MWVDSHNIIYDVAVLHVSNIVVVLDAEFRFAYEIENIIYKKSFVVIYFQINNALGYYYKFKREKKR